MWNIRDKRFFTIVGAQRSGTTYLYDMLDQHPEIAMNKPVRPEPKFHLETDEYNKTTQREFVEQYFQPSDHDAKIMGEKSTSYLEYGYIAERIDTFFPNSKILIILRNPVDRAASHYSFSKDNNLEHRSPEEALDIINENKIPIPKHLSVSPYTYISRGIYINFIKAYVDVFESRVKVVLFEDLVRDLGKIQEIYAFLDVSDSFIPMNRSEKRNESSAYQISDKIRKRLSVFYSPWNEKLSKKLGLSTEAWKL